MNRALGLEGFIKRMRLASRSPSAEQALDLLSNTLNQVEDELSGIPYQPEQWQNDGRTMAECIRRGPIARVTSKGGLI